MGYWGIFRPFWGIERVIFSCALSPCDGQKPSENVMQLAQVLGSQGGKSGIYEQFTGAAGIAQKSSPLAQAIPP
jgi:hypothetical protein